ncbi:MAG: FTR1 family iron permease [Candidatus Humimicrobiaceae bacterium]
MNNFIPGLIMGFREGLEAFLIIVIILRYLDKIDQKLLKKNVYMGIGFGVAISLLIGGALYLIANAIGNTDRLAKIWESAAGLIAVALVTTFIIWMIKHGANMTKHVESTTARSLSRGGIILISAMMVAREGVEVAIFAFAGEYSILSIIIGISISIIFAVLIFYSLIRVSIKIIFNITLIYLILQAGFLLGYGIHEGLAALKDIGYVAKDSFILAKVFDVSGTILDHKEGILGLPLYVLFGWYSKPEWVQFIAQYGYTVIILLFWYKIRKIKEKTV